MRKQQGMLVATRLPTSQVGTSAFLSNGTVFLYYYTLLLLSLSLPFVALPTRPVLFADAQEIVWDGCDVETYYDGIDTSTPSRTELTDLLDRTHRKVLPYTSSNGRDDVWKALKDVDESPDRPGQGYVQLIYRQVDALANLSGDPSNGWNREHLWPKSHGVYDDGPDFTDLHHLRPSDWNVNSARNNKYFGKCALGDIAGSPSDQQDSTTSTTTSMCTIPAHEEAANDTSADRMSFLPPQVVRGDIARTLFYMSVRYPYLELTDCPPSSDNDEEGDVDFQMAYKSQLLQWHIDDPVDENERQRNDKACSWQGNRNPFVDLDPSIVTALFGEPSLQDGPPYSYCTNEDGGITIIDVATATPSLPTPTETDTSTTTTSTTACPSDVLYPGSIMFVAVNSDNPDAIALVSLVTIPAGTVLYLTDKGWDDEMKSFQNNGEGIIRRSIVDQDIPAGTVFGYGQDFDEGQQGWEKISGSLSLSTSGDTIILYCQNDDGEDGEDGDTSERDESSSNAIHTISALSFGGKQEWNLDPDDTSTSDLPQSASSIDMKLATITLEQNADNFMYTGPSVGTADELRQYITDASNWISDNDDGFLDLRTMAFTVIESEVTIMASYANAVGIKTALRGAVAFLIAHAVSFSL